MSKTVTLRRIVFVTAGELPFENTLQESQVLETALLYKKLGREVSVVSFVPIVPFLLFFARHRRSPLQFFREKYALHGIDFHCFFSFIAVHSWIVFLCKNVLVRRAGNRLKKEFSHYDGAIFLARSYYATAICLSFRTYLGRSLAGSSVVFDSRSLLSIELAIKAPAFKDWFYARSIAWEKELVSLSDKSLAMTGSAKDRFISYGKNFNQKVHLIRLSGFQKDTIPGVDFEERWKNKYFVYVGYLGDWHHLDALEKIFEGIKRYFPDARLKILSNNASLTSRTGSVVTAKYREVPNLLNECLAMIIPGSSTMEDKYIRMQYEQNMFSTKAAEGLNCSQPLIVNERISGLSEFVRKNTCGVSVSLDDARFSPDGFQSKEFWMRATESAATLSSRFEREYNGLEILQLIENET